MSVIVNTSLAMRYILEPNVISGSNKCNQYIMPPMIVCVRDSESLRKASTK